MNEEHSKLIAKIQHFYEIMLYRLKSILDDSIASTLPDKKNSVEKVCIFNELLDEYEKSFESFLYKDEYEKNDRM